MSIAPIHPPIAPPVGSPAMEWTVAVRHLCDFTARAGDLDVRHNAHPSASEGIEGHGVVTARRNAGYEREVALSGKFGDQLLVRGRADGFDVSANRLEEIKTHRGDPQRIPAHQRALHWAQLRIYGHLLCESRGLDQLELALVYFELGSRQETVLTEHATAVSLREFFDQQCKKYVVWAAQEAAHRTARDKALATMPFPFADGLRTGQRGLAEGVFRTVRAERCLMAQAPTGIGKTLGTLFPALRACPPTAAGGAGLDRVFFLTAKNSGATAAFDALRQLNASVDGALPVRALELTSKEKACEHPESLCQPDSCPLARGFFDRLAAAREAAINAESGNLLLSRQAVRSVALEHGICPYFLAQELARWVDVVVADYHYWFDRSALLHGLVLSRGWRVAVLVDEAHNLLGRTRSMYSASLDRSQLRDAIRGAPAAVKSSLARLDRAWTALLQAQSPANYGPLVTLPEPFMAAMAVCSTALSEYLAADETGTGHGSRPRVLAADTRTAGLFGPSTTYEISFGGQDAARSSTHMRDLHLALLQFLALIESFDAGHSMLDLTREHGNRETRHIETSVLSLRNIVPAPHLQSRFQTAQATTLFSATLGPERYLRDLLGLPASTAWLDVAAPFAAAQLEVRVAGHISTRFSHRGKSIAPIARLLAQQFHARPGNYLAFFSSFDYLKQAADALAAASPTITQWRQSRGMTAADRDSYLTRFAEGSAGIGFAVLGGTFAEAIDLPGERLVGAFVATLGLPQLNAVNEEFCSRLSGRFGAGNGYDYTYLFPGLQKVVQAAGRVIRGPQERGVVWLMDDRFGRDEVRQLLPAWWCVQPSA